MRGRALTAFFAFLGAIGPASAQDAPVVQGTAHRAYEVFLRGCSSCHSERLRRPKGNFDFVLDLERLARAGEYVVRGRPDASALLHVIEDGSMPPPRSRVPALTEADRLAVRSWILAGAPPGPIDHDALPAPPRVQETSAVTGYLGELHPIVVHFPIGLLVAAALAEVLFALSGERRFRSAAEYCLLLGTAGACAATASGWFFATDLDYGMTGHRWLGVATNLFAIAACQLAVRTRRLPPAEAPTRAYRLAFAATIVLLVVTSHLGGTATWSDSVFAGS